MPILRIKHVGSSVEATWQSDGPLESETRPFSFSLSAQDAEDTRWYLEDYPIYPVDPSPRIARRIEQRMAEVGRELFRLVLGQSDVWASMRRNLGGARVEIETEVGDALVPWEWMRDPVADLPLTLQVPSFVRLHSRPALRPHPLDAGTGKIRILLAICRLQDDKLPFRSVARHLLRGLSDAAREPFYLEVLRPPTWEHLARRLRLAKSRNEPFHVLHFDGHGLAGEVFFENPRLKDKKEPVKAVDLGKLLHETGVPLLILNACRSADSEPPDQPAQVGDLHEQIRQFGSLAHGVMDYGAWGVLAWRYSVFADTAAQYMADLYGALASGMFLGEAATLARKQLSTGGRLVQDWAVPVVFEAAPIRIFPTRGETFEIKLDTQGGESGLPQAPDIGFIGRDETILRLDRAFDEQSIVLLHAYAGSGKTSTAAEFFRWYRQTGGVTGKVLFTSFEQHKALPRVVDELGSAFDGELAKSGIQWLTLDDTRRREVALQVLAKFPVLWIWDNVELIAGFPSGAASAWSEAEQKELADFLRAARETRAKFLLTSRRDERDWLHELPLRIELPPMLFDDSVRMTEELARKHGRGLEEVEDWRPLLRFTQGNPLTLTVLVGQALRDGLKSREQIAGFARKLEAGKADFDDEESEGRTRSLAASLAYGFENAFTERERKQLALLHLFHGFVDIGALLFMADPSAEWRLPELDGLTHEAGIALLDKAAEVGLLTELGDGCYGIHPAVPWFLRRRFGQENEKMRRAGTRAFAEAMGIMGNYYWQEYNGGNRGVIGALAQDEWNLLSARMLARANSWWHRVISTMQGLQTLYGHTGRDTDWARLVAEIVPDLIDPATDAALPGKEEFWLMVTGYRVRLAEATRSWPMAERLQNMLVEATRADDSTGKTRWQRLATALHNLAEIRREQGSAKCLEGYQEAFAIAEKIADSQLAYKCAFGIGVTYESLDPVADLELAEKWYMRSLELCAREDLMGMAVSLGQMGSIAFQRFLEGMNAKRPQAEYMSHAAKAEKYYVSALGMFPEDAVRELATAHHSLGVVYDRVGQVDAALRHYAAAIRYKESMGDRFAAGKTRYNAALALARSRRYHDALEWIQAALRDYEASENAEEAIAMTRRFMAQIASQIRA